MNTTSETSWNVYLLFDQDLRTMDNHLLEYARQACLKNNVKVVGLYMFDYNKTRQDENHYIQNESSPLRLKFILESIISFKQQLKELGNDLISFDCSLAEFMAKTHVPGDSPSTIVYTISLRNNRVIDEFKRSLPNCQQLFNCEGIWGSTIHCIQDLKVSYKATIEQLFQEYKQGLSTSPVRPIYKKVQSGDLPLVSHHAHLADTQVDLMALYRHNNQLILQNSLYSRMTTNDQHQHHHQEEKQEEKQEEEQEEKQEEDDKKDWMWRTHNNFDIDQVVFLGGEKEGLNRLNEYLDGDALLHYKNTKVQLYGRDFSSKLSCWLSTGCLSPRYVYLRVQSWGQHNNKQELARLFNDHLLIKDYQIYQANNFTEDQVISYGGVFNSQKRKWIYDTDKEQAFMEGRTGIPFVDACLQEAMATGYLSNRGRQVIAGYFSIEMHLDWRIGYKFFQRHFLDFHQEQCALSWQNVIGFFKERFDKTSLRQFELEQQHNNPNGLSIQQGLVYDPKGLYILRMLPQLQKLPIRYLHEPWTMINLGKQYIKYLQKIYIVNNPQMKAYLYNQKKGKSNYDIDYDKQKYGRNKNQEQSELPMSSTILYSIKSNQ